MQQSTNFVGQTFFVNFLCVILCGFLGSSVEDLPYPPGNCSIIVINLICQLVGWSLSAACFKTILYPFFEWINSQSLPLVRAFPLQLFRRFPIKPTASPQQTNNIEI